MTKDQEAQLIGMMYDWKAGKIELDQIIAFVVLVLEYEGKYVRR